MPFIHRSRRSYHLLIMLAFWVILLLAQPAGVMAQGGPIDVTIYNIDQSQLPLIQVFVMPTSEGLVLPDLGPENFQLYENETLQKITDVSYDRVGTQVAIVLDASGSFMETGVTDSQKKRITEAQDAIRALVSKEAQWLDIEGQSDWLMLMAPTSSSQFEVVQDWTSGYNGISNAAYLLKPVNGDTPLLKMLKEAMIHMKDRPDYEKHAKFLLVFSDGVDRISVQDITDIINRANKLGITILSVKIGPPNEGQARNLQRLAEETDGAYAVYQGMDSLAPLYERIRSQSYQYRLTYHPKNLEDPAPRSVQVEVLVDGKPYKSQAVTFHVGIQPLFVDIADPDTIPPGGAPDPYNYTPLDGKTIKRVTDDWHVPLNEIPPTQIPLPVIIRIPEDHNRAIMTMRLLVDGKVKGREITPDKIFMLDLSDLPKGENTLTLMIEVEDAFGIVSRSKPVRLHVIVDRPEPPSNSIIAGQAKGREGDQLVLLDAQGKQVASTTVGEDGSYQFTGLPEGQYIIRDYTQPEGVAEIGPIPVDGQSQIIIPPEKGLQPPPLISTKEVKSPFYWIPWILALLALAFSVYVYFKRPQAVMNSLTAVSNAVQEMTEPFRPRRGVQQHARASLVPILDDAGTRGKPIPIVGQSVYIGRDPARAQIVFSDPTVSRLHARIVEESDGVFLLYDEGSSSGTYVNEKPVTHEPVRLSSGDFIEFGRVRVIFVPESDAEVTEPFIGRS